MKSCLYSGKSMGLRCFLPLQHSPVCEFTPALFLGPEAWVPLSGEKQRTMG